MSENLSIKDELLRKLIHICSSAFAFALFFLNQQTVCLIVGFGAILILFFEILRSKYYPINKIFIKVFGKVTRNFEKTDLTGATYVMISSFIVLLPIFDLYISLFSIFIMSYSDTAAAIFGKKYGRTKVFNKTLEGSFAFFVVGFVIAIFIYPNINLGLAIFALFLATIVEALPINIDDNLSVPVIISLILSLGSWIEYIN